MTEYKLLANKLDTSWFNIKNYEPLKSMSIEDWALALQTRYFINDEYDTFVKQKTLRSEQCDYFSKLKAQGKDEYDDDYTQEDIEELADHLKHKCCSLVDSFEYYTAKSFVKDDDVNNSFSISSVNSLTVIESWDISEDGTFGANIDYQSAYQKTRDKHSTQSLMLDVMMHRMGLMEGAKNKAKAELTAESVSEYEKKANEFHEISEDYRKEFDGDEIYKDFISDAHSTPYDFRHKQYFNRDYISSIAHVTVDLDATNEQIENDFSLWLTNYRKASGYRDPEQKRDEKLFDQATFDYWIEYGLIPYIDLILIAKIEGKTITRKKLGELIFPDEFLDVNTEERIKTLTKPKAEKLLEDSTWWSLLGQAAAGSIKKKQRVNRYGNRPKKEKSN